MENLKGQLLVSSGGLYDRNFRHTVLLIGERASWGAVGVVLNRRLTAAVRDVVPRLAELPGADGPLFEGGPVQPQHIVLLADASTAEVLDVPVFGTVGFLTGDVPSEVQPLVRRARVFLGHAGWGPGQLEAELESESWIVEPASADDVFTDAPAAPWRRVLERKGPPYTSMARIPYDPTTN